MRTVENKLSPEELNKAKELIKAYCMDEFGHTAGFVDLENIGVAYTTLTDDEVPIQVSVDLIHMQLKTWIGDDSGEPTKTEDIDMDFLEILSFDDLISGWQSYIEENCNL